MGEGKQQTFSSGEAPEPVGAYPHAKQAGPFLFLSGVGPREKGSESIPGVKFDENNNILSYNVAEQTRSVFKNVKAILEASGATWDQLVDVTVFLTNMKDDFSQFNPIWKEYFPKNPPCRTTVEVNALPTPIAIELKCVAYVG